MNNKIIAVDFDGTLCENAFPKIGAPITAAINYVKEQQRGGAKLILWTNRCGDRLTEAVAWCKDQGLAFDAVNENLPELIEAFGNDCRKVFANEYFDDRAKPARQGRWDCIDDDGGVYKCSVCGDEWYLEAGTPEENNMHFCPHCGACMDAGNDQGGKK